MKTRKLFEIEITNKSNIKNINGYVASISDNLLKGIDISLFEQDLKQGSGNELKSKFKALYSSSALAVNNFSIVKDKISKFQFYGKRNFNNAMFERQFKTGLKGTPPNLDFTLESNEHIVAFESKYLELLERKKVSFKDSYNKNKLKYLSEYWFSLIDSYKDKYLYLDVAQLIKHSIGLINKKDKDITLVYIYWRPINYSDFTEYKVHDTELLRFSKELKKQKDITFISLAYDEFWDMYTNDKVYNNHFKKVKERYNIKVNN